MREHGRQVPVHASGSGYVPDCVLCGLPYAIHDHAKHNWLACPNELLGELAKSTWPVQGRKNGFAGADRIGAPDNLHDWLFADNRYPQHRGREAALRLIAELWWKSRTPDIQDLQGDGSLISPAATR